MNKVTEIIRDYIRENYMYDLSVQDLADKMNYSEPYFCRLFKQSLDRILQRILQNTVFPWRKKC